VSQAVAAPVPPATPRPGPDPIGATLLFSLLLHGVLLLGITFHFVSAKPSLPTLDVTLVDVANREAPDKADFLAQANNRGGGDSDTPGRPSQPISGLLPVPSDDSAVQPVQASAPRPQEATDNRLLTTTGSTSYSVSSDSAQDQHAEQPLPESPQDIERDRKAAQLEAELSDEKVAYAKRPRKKFLSANTAEGIYAAYLHGWFKRVERVGNLNYPDEARQNHIYGTLEMSVGLNRDGSIAEIQIIRSSGQPVLDAAAQRIVRLAAPFPAWPIDKERTTILYIDRTWEFGPGDVLRHH
jgi:protein TonB